MHSKFSSQSFNKVCILLTLFVLVFSACQPAPAVPSLSPTEKTPALIPSSTVNLLESNLKVVDDGSPLPPTVVQQQPQGLTEFPTEGQILLTFDQAMSPAETAKAWELTGVDGSKVAGKIDWPNANTFRFTPSEPLKHATVYRASLTEDAVSQHGINLKEPVNFQFTTMGALDISQVFPADGSKEISSSSTITVIFNRPVVPLVVSEDQANLPQPLKISPDTPGRGEWVNSSIYSFQPETALKSGTQYTIAIEPGLTDASGETSLETPYRWSFSTSKPRIDTLALSTGQVNPADNFKDVLPDVYFTLHFLQPMDKKSVESALSLTSTRGDRAEFLHKWDDASATLVFTPTVQLDLDAGYTLALDTAAQAAGGGQLEAVLKWQFRTISHPEIRSTTPEDNRQQAEFQSDFNIAFASPMRIETVKERIVISPEPEEPVEWWYNEYDWSMTGYFLKPSTQYVIRFLPGMEDIYGNVIQTEKTVRFSTAKSRPYASLALPYEVPIFRGFGPAESQQFYAAYTNVKTINFTLASLTADQFAEFLVGVSSAYAYRPGADTIVWEQKESSTGKLNERVLKKFQIKQKDGSPLSPGFYFLGMESPEISHLDDPFVDFRLLVVAGANLTFKSTATESLVWLTDLETGKPVSNARVTIYDQNYKPLNSGVTAEDGSLKLDLTAPEDPYETRFAVSQDGRAFGFASSQWGSGVSLYDLGIWGSYYAPADQPAVYIYTERPLYRPGQPVYFKGIFRQDNDLDYSVPAMSKVRVRISSYKDVVYEEDLDLTSFGSFSGKLLLDDDAVLGYYTIEVFYDDREQAIGSLTFNVAEYRKPEFQTLVSASPENVLQGDSFTATVQTDYYSGGSVSDAEVGWRLISEPFYFTPPADFSSYSFQDIDEDVHISEEDDEGRSQVIAEGKGATDASGRFSRQLKADLSAFKTSRQFTFEADVTDLAGAYVSGRAVVVAHKSAVYPGVKPQTYVGQQGKLQSFDIVALDWEGNALSNQPLSVEIVERRWYSVQEQDPSGKVSWKSSVEDIPVKSFPDLMTDEKGKAAVAFTPEKGGVYKARVTALDERRNPGRASAYVWVAGEDYIPWQQTNDRSFDLVMDKKQYSTGDVAQILIASPFQGDAYALVTVERGRIHFEKVIQLTKNSTVYQLPITPDLAPNAFVSVMIVKGVDDNNPRPNFKTGIKEFQVESSEHSLNVELISDQTTVGPGEKVSYTVRTTDAANKPVRAEVSLGLSDLATLSLFPPNSQPIKDFFFSRRNLGVWTSVPLSLNVDDYNAEIRENIPTGESQGSGGGKGEGDLGVVEVRQDFPDTAFWDAHVLTGDNGEATVVVTLPDNLTTWRMDARGVTKDTRVGQSEMDIKSTRPLLVRPQTPRFFVVGDQARLGTAVHNNTDEPMTATVALEAKGLTLQSPISQTVEIDARKQAYIFWDTQVDLEAKRVDLVFRAQSGAFKDASRPPQGTLDGQGIPVYRFEVPETVGTSGQITGTGTRVEGILLPSDLDYSDGKLTIQASPSLAAGLTEGLKYLEDFPYQCMEQTVSKILPSLATHRAFEMAGVQKDEKEQSFTEKITTYLQSLYKWQNPDGGWSWWGAGKSDPTTSAYVVLGLVEAQKSGFVVDQTVYNRARGYLRTQIVQITGLKDPQIINQQAFLLYVLSRSGKPDVSSTVQLYDQRQRMALYGRAFLAETLFTIDPSDPRIKTLLSDFIDSAILSATGSHWEETQTDRFNWNTDTRTTAIVLSALIHLDPKNPLTINAVRWLMSNRTEGRWKGTQETSWTLMALTSWMAESGELDANFEYAVALNGDRLLGRAVSNKNMLETIDLQVEVSRLLKEEINRLAFAHDGGTGNLYYTAYLNLQLPVEKLQPLDRGVVVSRSYYSPDDPEKPIQEVKVGELVLTRVTVVAPSALHFVLVDDPLPAGLEAVDQSLSTSPQTIEVPQEYSWNEVYMRGWGWWYFNNIQRLDEKVILSASYLPAGTYVYTYLARAGTVGEYKVMPPTAQEFYFPEVYGRGSGMVFKVTP